MYSTDINHWAFVLKLRLIFQIYKIFMIASSTFHQYYIFKYTHPVSSICLSRQKYFRNWNVLLGFLLENTALVVLDCSSKFFCIYAFIVCPFKLFFWNIGSWCKIYLSWELNKNVRHFVDILALLWVYVHSIIKYFVIWLKAAWFDRFVGIDEWAELIIKLFFGCNIDLNIMTAAHYTSYFFFH